jgi:hypothetical protein
MNLRTVFRNPPPRLPSLPLLLLLLVVAAGAVESPAQNTGTLLNFTDTWKYDQSGLELGTAWRTNDYDDSSWSSGRALFGFENSVPYPYPLSVRTPLTVSSTITSYYFRTTFQFSGLTNDLTLVASNFVDDGCVIYLNGTEAGRVRITNGYNATSYAQIANTEGQIDAVVITNLALLRQGENCLAAEVHQQLAASTDVVWGMKLVAIPFTPADPPVPLAIISEPESQTVVLDAAVTFSVGAVGELPTYQWQKDGVNVANATSATYTIPAAAYANSGQYRAIIADLSGSVTSTVASLTVVPDLVGPEMVSALATNGTILVRWSEVLQSVFMPGSTVTNLANYSVEVAGTADSVPITVIQMAGTFLRFRLDTSDPDWRMGGHYIVTASNVKDRYGNRIAPGSQIAVSWITTNTLISSEQLWSFHDSASVEPDVADRAWYATNFVENVLWSSGRGTFHNSVAQLTPCFGTLETEITYQAEPVLFRTTFERPAELGSAADLSLRFNADDGVVLYLNGQEFYRTNLAPVGWELDSSSRAVTDRSFNSCSPLTLAVTNLLPGTNWFAAAVYEKPGTGDNSVHFGLELTSTNVLTPVLLPVEPPPQLHLTWLAEPANRVVMDWTGHGFALESTTTFSNNLSYPLGPWVQVTNMANPYTNSGTEPFRFFRLKK